MRQPAGFPKKKRRRISGRRQEREKYNSDGRDAQGRSRVASPPELDSIASAIAYAWCASKRVGPQSAAIGLCTRQHGARVVAGIGHHDDEGLHRVGAGPRLIMVSTGSCASVVVAGFEDDLCASNAGEEQVMPPRACDAAAL
ncbi:hypothetical protein C8Q76DRAFT_792175 [Earliella scabrosa]|nr:hypothetical protein C8Q76DRAFT_801430 [Earliella scabrosa]KAI0735650.1 hypothetical protein C8Q76DRAFT_792175 [Earliella scabrosa]